MSWKFWKKAKHPVEQKLVDYSSFTVTIDKNGVVKQHCIFPENLPLHEMEKSATYFAKMLSLLHHGQILPIIQKAVTVGGQICDETYAQYVMHVLNTLVADEIFEKASRTPLVSPRNVFSPPSQGGVH